MPDMPMMPWFPNDFRASTLGWTLVERAVYHMLLDCQWDQGHLPNDTARLARIVEIPESEFLEVWDLVKTKFVEVNGCLVNEKLESHRQKALQLRSKRKAAAAASVKARAQTSAEAKPKHPSPSPSPSSKSKSKSEKSPKPDFSAIENLDHEAWQIWQAYRREQKLKAYTSTQMAARLAKYSTDVQRAAIDESITQGWQGLFPEKVRPNATHQRDGAPVTKFDQHRERLRQWFEETTG